MPTELQDNLDWLDEAETDGPEVAIADIQPIVDAARRWVVVQEAITNEGPQPRVHRKITKRHQEEWPTLWAALCP